MIAEGEALSPQSSEPRIADLTVRGGEPPHKYPDAQLFTVNCRRVGMLDLPKCIL